MRIQEGDIVIRSAVPEDAPTLNRWWNDGRIMAYAGYPDGLGESLSESREVICSWQGKPDHLCMIEIDGRPAGELSYRLRGDGTAWPAWVIADPSLRNKGYGSRIIRLLFHFIFSDPKTNENFPVDRIIWDTPVGNKRARHVYEKKIGARLTGIRERDFMDQRGRWLDMAVYEMSRERFMQLESCEKSPFMIE
ncbi:MAG TPA: GNAT family N-acetyltransferase [Clostridiaceae bacterium]|nr:GNAT family N-acetyltransferase [Clostridiaceae bacterium]